MLDLAEERKKLEPWWFTVHEAVKAEREEDCRPAVRVRFLPIGRIALRAARRAAGACYNAADLPEDENAPVPIELIESAGDALSEALLIAGIDAWEGVGYGDEPVPVSPEMVKLFLADPLRFEKLDEAYVRPFVLRELEKNELSLSPNGISAGATITAATSAKPTASGDVSPKVRKRGAHTTRTSRKRKAA